MSAESLQESILRGIREGTLDAFIVLAGGYAFQGLGGSASDPRKPLQAGAGLPACSQPPTRAEVGDTFFRSTFQGSNPADSLALFHSIVELITSMAPELGQIRKALEGRPSEALATAAAKAFVELKEFAGLAQSDLLAAVTAAAAEDEETRH